MSQTNPGQSGIETLSGVDGAFLNLETIATPMHVGSLHLFETPPDYHEDFFLVVQRMMEQRMVPVLRRRLASLPLHLANPAWVQGEVDLNQHIRRVPLPEPGTWAQLEAVVADLHAELLDRSRPLWMIYVLDGLASGDNAYYFKIHHAMLDGQAGVALAAALFDTTPLPPGRTLTEQRPTRRPPGTLALAAAAVRHDAAQYIKLVRQLPGVVRTLAGIVRSSGGNKNALATPATDSPDLGQLRRSLSFGPRTALNVAITRERSFASATVPRASLKAIAQTQQASVNDVVLALCSGALRRYLQRHTGIPRKALIASMPISLRDPGNTDFRTQATLSLVSLATQIADPIQRLQAIRDSAGATKAVARRAKSVIPTDLPLLGVPWLLGTVASLYGRRRVINSLPVLANLVISNVPGPPLPLYVDGLRMSGYWPLSIVEHGVGLNITLIGYAGAVCLGFTAARCALPDARQLADDFLAAFEEMKQRLPTAAQVVPTQTAAPKSAAPTRAGAPKIIRPKKVIAPNPVTPPVAIPKARAVRARRSASSQT